MTLNEIKYGDRNSKMHFNEVYFWTDTIKDWNRLLNRKSHKKIIIECWQHLIARGKIKLYAFVIMPNHLHVVWEMLEMNGKEMPHASFNKFTSHEFLKKVRIDHPDQLSHYKVPRDAERQHRFWQRDPLAVLLTSKRMAEQKIGYIHLNPLQEQWNLTNNPTDYRWSSPRFYETGMDEFKILTDYRDRF
jgi:putative transposase